MASLARALADRFVAISSNTGIVASHAFLWSSMQWKSFQARQKG
jgi:hypothetical protein